jgi:hypothetical protein
MTVPELIASVLANLRQHFYTNADTGALRAHDFKRDERQLIRAIATYGYECDQRGWQFQADFIYQDLMALLLQIRTSGADIGYLPIYLQGAIRRHLGQRAEELSAAAKALPARVHQVLSAIGDRPSAIVQPSDVEIFTQVYRGLAKIQRQRRRQSSPRCRPKQPDLL